MSKFVLSVSAGISRAILKFMAVAAAGAIALGVTFPGAAWADHSATGDHPTTQSSATDRSGATVGETELRMYSTGTSSKMQVSVPTGIYVVAQSNGEFITPTTALSVQNSSIFQVHVAKINVQERNNFDFVSQAELPTTDIANAMALQLSETNNTTRESQMVDYKGGRLTQYGSWEVSRGSEAVPTYYPFSYAGGIANVDADLRGEQNFASMEWTFSAGNNTNNA